MNMAGARVIERVNVHGWNHTRSTAGETYPSHCLPCSIFSSGRYWTVRCSAQASAVSAAPSAGVSVRLVGPTYSD